MNKTFLIGRLTKDPELRTTKNGISCCMFTLAVNRSFQNQSGEKQTDFINCVAWRAQADNLCKYMSKGSQIAIEGRIENRSYEDTNGVNKRLTEIIVENISFLESKKVNQEPEQSKTIYDFEKPKEQQDNNVFQNNNGFDISGDDLPF